jgi:hypothetical protein
VRLLLTESQLAEVVAVACQSQTTLEMLIQQMILCSLADDATSPHLRVG